MDENYSNPNIFQEESEENTSIESHALNKVKEIPMWAACTLTGLIVTIIAMMIGFSWNKMIKQAKNSMQAKTDEIDPPTEDNDWSPVPDTVMTERTRPDKSSNDRLTEGHKIN